MTHMVHTSPATLAQAAPQIHDTIEVGGNSPWGTIEEVQYLADGITYVSTARHGGFHVSQDLLYRVPVEWRESRHGATADADSCWFEEDADWSMVVMIFTNHFNLKTRHAAKDIFEGCVRPKIRKVA